MTRRTEKLLRDWKCNFNNCRDEWLALERHMDKLEAAAEAGKAYAAIATIVRRTGKKKKEPRF